MAESDGEQKSFLMKVKEETENVALKLNIKTWWYGIQSHHFIANRNWKMETVTDFISSGSKITVDSDSSHEIKRHLLLGNKNLTNLDSELKIRDITLLTNVCTVKGMVFSVACMGVRIGP